MPRFRRSARRSSVLFLASLSALVGAGTLLGCDKPEAPPEAPASEPAAAAQDAPAQEGLQYPQARKGDVVDDYHGTEVADPYRWLEDTDSDETRAWIEAENAVTDAYLAEIGAREAIEKRLTSLWNYERYGVPGKEGGRYFVSKNDGLQDQSVVYWTDDLGGELQTLLDPNELSEDGTVALNGMAVSDDGALAAYALSSSGSDWKEWHVREVETGKDLPDVIKWSKFSGAAWDEDADGFYYAAYDAPKEGEEYEGVNKGQKLYYHRLGKAQADDALIYENPEQPEWGYDPEVTDDGRYLVIEITVGTETKKGYSVLPLGKKKAEMIELLPEFDANYAFVGNKGPKFWFWTDRGAPRGRLIQIDVRNGKEQELIPQGRNKLRSVSAVGGRFVCQWLEDAKSMVTVHKLDGKIEKKLTLPGIGSTFGFGGDLRGKETFYGYQSFTQPTTIYRYDFKSGESEVWKQPKMSFDPADFVTEQVFYESKDGTKVPMFIVHHKDVQADGDNPTYLYGYGGFNISLTPRFSVPDLVWMEMGGVYAQPNLRGGGEYGETWHQAGTKLNKQNVFDDFIAAAEWLLQNKWTSVQKLSVGGRSNGGLLVGAAITQRPDLFRAALAGVGVMDMLRFHKFTIGWAWVSDYGSSEDPEQFKALHAYSPLHNVRPNLSYPATMIYTADHDDRVVPGHSFKFAATLQEAQRGDNPVLIRIDTKAGHGAGKPTSKRIEEWADLWGFLARELEMTLPEGM